MNTPILSDFFQQTMADAVIEAQNRGHVVIWPEHVFAVMCKDITIYGTLRDAGFDAETLPGHVYSELTKRKSASQASPADTPAKDLAHSLQLILQHASQISQISPMVNHLAMLDALAQSNTPIGEILREMGVDDHRNRHAQLQNTAAASAQTSPAVVDSDPTRNQKRTRSSKMRNDDPPVTAVYNDEDLPDFCTNLNALVVAGKIEKAIGRDKEMEKVEDTLLQRKKKNPLLVGHGGVGKTAIAEGLAWRIVHGEVSPHLRHKKIYSLNLAALTGGTEHRGAFEKKLGDFLKKVSTDPNTILFIDEVHTVMGLGAVSGGGTDASNMLKTYMSGSDISVIGATTFKEEKIIWRDPAMSRRFNKVPVHEPSLPDAIKIVSGAISGYEEAHGVTYSPSAIKTATTLTNRYISDIKMPDSIFGVLDAAGVIRKKKTDGRNAVTVQDIRTVISRRSGVDIKQLKKSDLEKLANFDAILGSKIIGQDKAVAALSNAARMAHSPLRNHEKPISFLFPGPTGVGKTESAKQMASLLNMNFIRVDMSELMEPHAISKLIGAPPGYVGYGEGGQLTEKVAQKPYSIVLLDEIEKAHPVILNAALQILDHGAITDSEGNEINFRNTIIIMTTNAGTAGVKNAMGFGAVKDSREEQIAQNMKGIFSPEFLNRFDAVIPYKQLSPENMPAITNLFLRAAQPRLDELKLKLECQDSALKWLIKNGFSSEYGARPMGRLIEEHIMQPINNAYFGGQVKKKGIISVTFNESAGKTKTVLDFEFKNPAPKAPAPKAA